MKLRKAIGLVCATTLIVGGSLLLIAWEHPISIIWTNPIEIFWSDHIRSHSSGGRLWWMGPLLIAAGAFWIAEDWFGFGRSVKGSARDSALKVGKPPALKAIDHAPRGPLP